MSKSPQVGPLTPLTKKKFFDGLAPWQVVLSCSRWDCSS